MWSYMERLKDPQMVWDIQQYFGIRRVSPNERVKTVFKNCNGTVVKPTSATTTTNFAEHINGTTVMSNGNHAYICNNKQQVHHSNGITNLSSKPSSNGLLKNGSQVLSQRTVESHNLKNSIREDVSSGGTSDSDSGQSGETRDPTVDYMITKPFWYYIFCFGAALGDETFYSSFFPFWFWNVDGAVCRRVVLIWILIMYIGQGLKDIIRWPRPSCPPVVRLEEKWQAEFGMPSTHASVGASVPFSFLFFTMYRYEYPVILGVIICSVWCCVICGSRLYLGMHTVLDIIAGILLAVLLMCVLIPYIDLVDYFALTSTVSPPCILFACFLMIMWYPDAGHWTPARGDTVIILGVGAGIAAGSWLNYQWGIISGPPMPPPYKILWPTYEMVGLTMLRTCIGILVVVATRAVFKSLTYAAVCYLLKLDPHDKSNWRKTTVELSSKFLTYAAIAFNAAYLAPAVFRFMNIERATMFTEV